jgi:hypothetical protein
MRLFSAVVAMTLGVCAVRGARADELPPAPEQPIAFSHKIHAGEAGIGCMFCHAYVEHSPVAGVPAMARCAGCHKFVKQDPDRPAITAEIKPLLQILKDGGRIEWVRVHRLPDHVYFTHQRHVLAGVDCKECHGDVASMDRVRQVAPLTMGWCLSCHHQKQAEQPAGRARLTDCVTCHK